MAIAVYPGTFDPVHMGHVDIAGRAADLFDELVVGVYDQPMKGMLFPTPKRVEMIARALAHLPNVMVRSYEGLTVDFVRSVGARVIVRGMRVIKDFELEYQMALANRKLAPEVDVVCLMTGQDYAFLSSTIVKEIAGAGGQVRQFVPEHVEEALLARLGQAP